MNLLEFQFGAILSCSNLTMMRDLATVFLCLITVLVFKDYLVNLAIYSFFADEYKTIRGYMAIMINVVSLDDRSVQIAPPETRNGITYASSHQTLDDAVDITTIHRLGKDGHFFRKKTPVIGKHPNCPSTRTILIARTTQVLSFESDKKGRALRKGIIDGSSINIKPMPSFPGPIERVRPIIDFLPPCASGILRR